MKARILPFSMVLLVFLFSASPQVKAARPLTTDDAGTVELGVFETEFGYEIPQNKDNAQSQSLSISLKHGLSQRLDFGISFPYEIKPERGLGEAEAGIKFFLSKEKENLPALSLTFAFGLGSSEYTLNGIMSKELGNLLVHLNLGYIATGIVTEEGITTYSGAIELPLGKKLTLVAELVGETDTGRSSSEGLIGGNFQVIKDMTLDFGIGKGFDKANSEWKTILGITYGF